MDIKSKLQPLNIKKEPKTHYNITNQTATLLASSGSKVNSSDP